MIQIQVDGRWTVKVHTYDKRGKQVTTNVLEITRDTEKPKVTSFITTSTTNKTQVNGIVDEVSWGISGPASLNTYTYYLGTKAQASKTENIHNYTGINIDTIDLIKVKLLDKAGNESDLFSPTKTTYYLAQLANINDNVAFDAGNWETTKPEPVNNAEIGGFTAGTNKGMGIKGTKSGWKIVGIER